MTLSGSLVAADGVSTSPLALTASVATPSPSPSTGSGLQPGLEPGDVSPGLLGFLPVFAIALVCIVLFRSLTTKLRGVKRRQEQLDAEEAAALAAAGPADRPIDGPTDGPTDQPTDGPARR